MDSTTILIVAVVLLSDLIVIFVISRANKARRLKVQQRIATEAEAEGWKSLPITSPHGLCRLEGTISSASEIRWELIVERSGNLIKNSTRKPKSQSIIWQTRDVRLGEEIIGIGPGGRFQLPEIDLGNSMVQAALRRIYGDDLAPLLAHAHIMELPEGTLPRIYMAISNNAALAEEFLREPIAPLIREWQSEKMPIPAILFWNGGMQIRFLRGTDDIETMRKVVTFCSALALRGKELVEEGRRQQQQTFTA